MKQKKCLLLLLCAAFLVGCDPMTTYKKVIHNDSKYILSVKDYGRANTFSSYVLQATYNVHPNSELVLSDGSYLGDPNSPCIHFGDSIVASVSDQENLKVDLDFNDSKNWERSKSGSNAKGYRIECHSTVQNEYVKPK